MAALNIGDTAPDFELQAVTGDQKHKFKLSDYRGRKHVVLAFYAVDFSPA
jgi:peroxiredoxin